jgi:hypothetical protein
MFNDRYTRRVRRGRGRYRGSRRNLQIEGGPTDWPSFFTNTVRRIGDGYRWAKGNYKRAGYSPFNPFWNGKSSYTRWNQMRDLRKSPFQWPKWPNSKRTVTARVVKRKKLGNSGSLSPNGVGMFKLKSGLSTTNNGFHMAFTPACTGAQVVIIPICPVFYSIPLRGMCGTYKNYHVTGARLVGININGNQTVGVITYGVRYACAQLTANPNEQQGEIQLSNGMMSPRASNFDMTLDTRELREWYPTIPRKSDDIPACFVIRDSVGLVDAGFVINVEFDVVFQDVLDRSDQLQAYDFVADDFVADGQGFKFATQNGVNAGLAGTFRGVIIRANQNGPVDLNEFISIPIANSTATTANGSPGLHNEGGWNPLMNANERGTFSVLGVMEL